MMVVVVVVVVVTTMVMVMTTTIVMRTRRRTMMVMVMRRMVMVVMMMTVVVVMMGSGGGLRREQGKWRRGSGCGHLQAHRHHLCKLLLEAFCSPSVHGCPPLAPRPAREAQLLCPEEPVCTILLHPAKLDLRRHRERGSGERDAEERSTGGEGTEAPEPDVRTW